MNDFTQGLRVFVKVAERESFAVVARDLNMANSSVTRHIAKLEQKLSVPLFVRTTRQVRLSPAGERAYQHAIGILAQVDELQRDIRAEDDEVSGLLRISVPWRYARMYVGPILGVFVERYPKVRVEILSDDKLVNLVEEGFDVAIRIGRLADSSLVARKIGDQPFLLAAAPSYLEAHSPIRTHDDLEHHAILTFSYATANYSWKLKKDGKTYRIPASRGMLSSNNADLITRAAVDGAGIVAQPKWAIWPDIDSGALVPILLDYEVTSTAFQTGVYIVYTKENRNNPRVRAWVDFVAERFRMGVQDR